MIETYTTSILASGLEPTERLERRKRKAMEEGLARFAEKLEPGKRYTLIIGDWQERPTQFDTVELSLEIEVFANRPHMPMSPNFFTEKEGV